VGDKERALVNQVARYEQSNRYGLRVAVWHDELFRAIDELFGRTYAEYFDQERSLPYAVGGLPWPMKRHDASAYSAVRGILSILLGIASVAILGPLLDLDLLLAIIAGGVVGAAVYVLLRYAPMLRPPKDLSERYRLAEKFRDMQVAEVIDQERTAVARREERLRIAEEHKRQICDAQTAEITD